MLGTEHIMMPPVACTTGPIVGMGDPVMDILAKVEHSFLATITSEPGGCTPVTPAEMQAMLQRAATQSGLKRIPGGSAANVMKGLCNISRRTWPCKFMGMVGQDNTGKEYREKLAEQGVQPVLLQSDSGAPSACALCFVTPDGQRTMRTCLGASLELQQPQQLPNSWHAGMRLLHCEGYCLYRAQFTKAVMVAAKAQGAQVSLDLASFELVRHCKSAFLDLLQDGCVDLLFANEEEAITLAEELSLGEHTDSRERKITAAQNFLLQYVKVSIVSMGARGCQARSNTGEQGQSGAPKVTVIDTIGAGDCFTAGFLYAYIQGARLQQCCEVGCEAGAAAVQAEGAELSQQAWTALQDKASRMLSTISTDTLKQNELQLEPQAVLA